jgi:hypothetical protein
MAKRSQTARFQQKDRVTKGTAKGFRPIVAIVESASGGKITRPKRTTKVRGASIPVSCPNCGNTIHLHAMLDDRGDFPVGTGGKGGGKNGKNNGNGGTGRVDFPIG